MVLRIDLSTWQSSGNVCQLLCRGGEYTYSTFEFELQLLLSLLPLLQGEQALLLLSQRDQLLLLLLLHLLLRLQRVQPVHQLLPQPPPVAAAGLPPAARRGHGVQVRIVDGHTQSHAHAHGCPRILSHGLHGSVVRQQVEAALGELIDGAVQRRRHAPRRRRRRRLAVTAAEAIVVVTDTSTATIAQKQLLLFVKRKS